MSVPGVSVVVFYVVVDVVVVVVVVVTCSGLIQCECCLDLSQGLEALSEKYIDFPTQSHKAI